MRIFRRDTEKEHRTDILVDEDRQQFIGVLGMRGEGKSYIVDTEAERAFLMGYLIMDLHGADNLENGYYVFPSEDPEVSNPIRIPITLIAQETVIIDPKQVEQFNSREATEEEFYKEFPYDVHHKIYNPVNPPTIKMKKPLIKIEIIPPVTSSKAEYETESNQKALDKIIEIIMDCRLNRRIFVLNRMMFASERQYYWTMELIVRNLVYIAEKNFKRLEPKDVGFPEFVDSTKRVKTPRSVMKQKDRNFHRTMVVTRELGELCPSRSMKGDKTGESLSVKKAFFNFIRKARHPQIDWIADWQRNNDVEDAIRSQADKWVLKRYNEDLGGEDKRKFFETLYSLRDAIYREHGPIAGKFICKSNYPDIAKLDPRYHYLYIHGKIHLRKVRKLRHLHKEPWHRFSDKTGIAISHDYTKIKEKTETGKSKTKEQDQAYLYTIVRDMKDPMKNKKPLKADEILIKLKDLQENGKVTFHLPFNKMTPKGLSSYFNRWKGVFNRINTSNSD